MTAPQTDLALPEDLPFPLARNFMRRVLPGLALVLILSAGGTLFAASQLVSEAYLTLASNRAGALAREIKAEAPAAWQALTSVRPGGPAPDPAQITAFYEAARHAQAADGAPMLDVYDAEGRLWAGDAADLGRIEHEPPVDDVLANGRALRIKAPDKYESAGLFEMYVPVKDSAGRIEAVFEFYEPQGLFDRIVAGVALPVALVPAALLAVLSLVLVRLVRAGQADIDRRTHALTGLRRRIESLVSGSAVKAARAAHRGATALAGDLASRRVETALLYSDLRGFTAYSENAEPEAVILFLNRAMALQIEAVEVEGGDVDKMIADALLARFDGPDGAARALRAAIMIQERAAREKLKPGMGIGLHTGPVVEGPIGPAGRRDFTIIGDSVNIAARLCSAAREGEILVSDALWQAANADPESYLSCIPDRLAVKGRLEAVAVRRIVPILPQPGPVALV